MKDFHWPEYIKRPLPWEKAQQPQSQPAHGSNGDTDLDKRICAYVDAIPGAISGQGGHGRTFKVACYLINGWDLSADQALPYLQGYNQRCEPPWTDKELAHKLSDAEKAPHDKPRGYLREEPQSATQNKDRPRNMGDDWQEPPLDFSRYNELNSTFPEPMARDAFYGLAGKVVNVIAPQSEACREAILIHFLCALGNLIGRSAYAYGGDSTHHPRLWTILVGDTSKGRKGTAWNGVKRLLERLDKKWIRTRLTSGASSGEGIIHNVRDAKYGIAKSPKKPKPGDEFPKEEVLLDAGEHDKRLLLLEEEFAQVFRVIERTGNTLSPVLRQAWDGSQLTIPNKNSGERATNPHITVIAHITKEELARFTGSAELLNGFANRFLWCAARRSQSLPFSECAQWEQHKELLEKLCAILKTFNPADQERRLYRSQSANELWEERYERLSSGYGGTLGGILNRAEAQVFRLSMLYTVLDNSTLIVPEHIKAALAVWNYSVRSAKWIFGNSTGNWRADKILWELQRSLAGVTRTKINDEVFKRNSTKTDIDQALSVLVQNKLAAPSEIREGRYRTELWKLCKTGL